MEILTPDEVAELLRLARSRVILLAKHGEIPAFVIDGRLRFQASDIEQWLKEKRIKKTLIDTQ